jgi:thioredoxin reductase
MFDVIIIGAGPAGLTAVLYATGYGLNAICIGDPIGGKLIAAPDILDYPGIENISGDQVVDSLKKQVARINGKVEQKTVTEIHYDQAQQTFTISCSDNSALVTNLVTKSVIIATGNGNKQKENMAVKLCSQLNIETQDGRVVIDENNMTSASGVFAAGDCIVFPRSLEQLASAVATGITAATGVYGFIKHEKSPILWGSSKIPRR